MEAHRTRATVGENGEVALSGVPFQPGEDVDVIVLRPAESEASPAKQHTPPQQQRNEEQREKEQRDAEDEPESGTAGAMRHSGLVGLWEDRDDELPPSPEYARQLREKAQRRPHTGARARIRGMTLDE